MRRPRPRAVIDLNPMESSTKPRRLLRSVMWRRLDQPGLEGFRLCRDKESFRLDGTFLLAFEGVPFEVQYEVVCDLKWETQATRVRQVSGKSSRSIELRRDEGGRWWRDGVEVGELQGIRDVDLGFTPSTNTLPIRRLDLEVGAHAEVNAAWLRFPELTLEVLTQSYTRLDQRRYRYESGDGSFVANLEVDDLGVVLRYGQWFEVVGEWSDTGTG